MKLALFGSAVADITQEVASFGFSLVNEDPDIVLSYGGDGTFLKSEASYPGVLKLLIKNSATCKLCTTLPLQEVLSRLSVGEYSVKEVTKLKVTTGNVSWYALNDVVVHNKNPRHAVRFSVTIGERTFSEVIGDGVVVATTLGSTGYYKSITQQQFSSGVGIAFNNTAQHHTPLLVPDNALPLTISIVRGPAIVYVDNSPEEVVLNDGAVVTITHSEHSAKVLSFD